MDKSDLTLQDLSPFFHLPINEASKRLGICATVLKKICRRIGISRWPHRKFKSVDALIEKVKQEGGEDATDKLEYLEKTREMLVRQPNLDFKSVVPKNIKSARKCDISLDRSPRPLSLSSPPPYSFRHDHAPRPAAAFALSASANTASSSGTVTVAVTAAKTDANDHARSSRAGPGPLFLGPSSGPQHVTVHGQPASPDGTSMDQQQQQQHQQHHQQQPSHHQTSPSALHFCAASSGPESPVLAPSSSSAHHQSPLFESRILPPLGVAARLPAHRLSPLFSAGHGESSDDDDDSVSSNDGATKDTMDDDLEQEAVLALADMAHTFSPSSSPSSSPHSFLPMTSIFF